MDLYNLGPKEITLRPLVNAIPNLQVVYNIKIKIINICYVLKVDNHMSVNHGCDYFI